MTQDNPENPRKFLEYLDELIGRLRSSIILFIAIFFLTFLFGFKQTVIYGIKLYYPFPDFYSSISIKVIDLIEKRLVPPGFILINISPFDTVVTIAYTSISISAAITIPLMIYQIIKFSLPALYPRERKAIILAPVAIIALFIIGVAFSIMVVLPLLFKVILVLSRSLNVEPTMGIKNFISIILMLSIGIGLSFETPVVVILLSYFKVVKPEVWFRNWRYAVIGAFFIALLISPGATGGIMEVTIATVILTLYFIGALIAFKVYKK